MKKVLFLAMLVFSVSLLSNPMNPVFGATAEISYVYESLNDEYSSDKMENSSAEIAFHSIPVLESLFINDGSECKRSGPLVVVDTNDLYKKSIFAEQRTFKYKENEDVGWQDNIFNLFYLDSGSVDHSYRRARDGLMC